MRNGVLMLCLLPSLVHANIDSSNAVVARNQAIKNLQTMNAQGLSALIPRFTSTPSEVQFYKETEGESATQALIQAGHMRAQQDETTRFVIHEDAIREKITPNQNSADMRDAERLLENPETSITPSAIACADGSCDTTAPEVSDDTNEGLSRLGAVVGAATDVAIHQTNEGQASIFKGEVIACGKYPLSTRDCCTDKGFLEGLMHCPAEMRVLQRAKVDNRVVSLGHYKNHLLGKTRYVYCVFPTTLASIVQLQGRGAQLHIPFGTAKQPDCRGLMPHELERINFKALDLNAFIKEVTDKTTLPDNTAINSSNITHVDTLFREGRAYD
jgi:hypothetical protein